MVSDFAFLQRTKIKRLTLYCDHVTVLFLLQRFISVLLSTTIKHHRHYIILWICDNIFANVPITSYTGNTITNQRNSYFSLNITITLIYFRLMTWGVLSEAMIEVWKDRQDIFEMIAYYRQYRVVHCRSSQGPIL